MVTLEDLRFFAKISTAASLAAAARELGVTPPAVTQRLRQLEERLGIRLVDRSTRKFALTAEGAELARRGGAVLADVEEITAAVSGQRDQVIGELRVVAPFGFGRRFVAPAAERFRRAYPGVAITLRLVENPVALKAEAWDVIVHVGELPDSTLVMRPLAPNERLLCAAPAYLAARGTPLMPTDLPAHDCLALRENDEDVTLWRLIGRDGMTLPIRVRPAMASNDGEVVRRWGLAGQGVIMRSEWDVAEDLAAGRLVRLLPDWRLAAAPIVALLGPRAGRTARSNRFLDLLRADLDPPPWRPDHSPTIRKM